MGVEPEYTAEEKANLDKSVPNVKTVDLTTAEKTLKDAGLTYRVIGSGGTVTDQLPAANAVVAAGSQIILYADAAPSDSTETMSRQKYLYLPEEHNDFIFSIVCEELGYIGAIVILILFALLIIRGYWLAMHSRDRFSYLVCAGITTLLAIQVIFNVAVVTNLIPCTGVSLPFFSSGGTALLLQLSEMGIILSMSRDIPAKKVAAPPKKDE